MEVQISKNNWNKILNYAHAAYDMHKSEIGGMAVCVEDEDGDWIIEQPVILKQEISAGNCVLDKDELAKYYTKVGMSKKYKNSNFRFLWWHSHHTMSAFWSGTDLAAIEEFNEGDFSFALVINLKEEYKMRVSVWKPLELHEDVDLDIIGEEKSIPKKILDEVEELCNKPTSTTFSYNSKFKGYNTHQKSLFKKRTKKEDEFEELYIKVWDALEQSLGETVSGELPYKTLISSIQAFNKKLLKKGADLSIKTPEESEIWSTNPFELIKFDKEFAELVKEIADDLQFDNGWSGYSYYGGI